MGFPLKSTDSTALISASFDAGMRLNSDLAHLAPNEYYLLINARNRDGKLKPVKQPVNFTPQIPISAEGLFQGVYGVGSSLIVFVDGYAYLKDFATSMGFSQVTDNATRMNPYVNRVYGQLVPVSYLTFRRTASSPSAPIVLTSSVDSIPSGFLAQDGATRPTIIFSAALARRVKQASDWTPDNPEYVPVGRQMLYFDGILYVVSANGKELYRSLTGRGLDFVIAVNNDGNKLDPGNYIEEAQRLSHAIDYDPITCLFPLSSSPDEDINFFASTSKNSRRVIPNYLRVLFGEPTFRNADLFPTGPVNQFSMITMLGDNAFIDATGIKSFNAIAQDENEGRSSPISREIAPLFFNRIQNDTCAWSWDNYGLFAVNTIYGETIVVFDQQTKRFVALDFFGLGKIKQFAEIELDGIKRLFFITATGLYEAYAGATANAAVYPKEWAIGDLGWEHRISEVKLKFKDIEQDGNVNVSIYADGKLNQGPLSKPLKKNYTRPVNENLPFVNSEKRIKNVTIPFSKSQQATNIGCWIEWNFEAELHQIQINPEPNPDDVSASQQGPEYASS